MVLAAILASEPRETASGASGQEEDGNGDKGYVGIWLRLAGIGAEDDADAVHEAPEPGRYQAGIMRK